MERVIRRPRKVLLLTKSRGFPIDRSIEIDRRGIKIRWVLIPDQLYVRPRPLYLFMWGTGRDIIREVWDIMLTAISQLDWRESWSEQEASTEQAVSQGGNTQLYLWCHWPYAIPSIKMDALEAGHSDGFLVCGLAWLQTRSPSTPRAVLFPAAWLLPKLTGFF